jgi:4-carboxymuconolactone decarboxylase
MMTIEKPRIPPLERSSWTHQSREVFSIVEGEEARANGSRYNTILIMANNPDLAASYLPFSNHLLRHSSLPPRLREIIINRTAYVSNSTYVMAQHRPIGLRAGLTSAEIDAIQGDYAILDWLPFEKAALKAVDEIKQNCMISDETWAVLAAQWDRGELLEFLFTVGNYIMYSIYLNNSQAQLEA